MKKKVDEEAGLVALGSLSRGNGQCEIRFLIGGAKETSSLAPGCRAPCDLGLGYLARGDTRADAGLHRHQHREN